MAETLPINNPFGAPVYYKESVTSTMDEVRLLSEKESGTVIAAGEQSAGRGRAGRFWNTGKKENLSFTIVLRYSGIGEFPPALTLRTGLAVTHAIEDFTALAADSQNSPLAGRILLKWPNDVMLLDRTGQGRKAVGILTEAEGGNVYIGVGVNIGQRNFPPELVQKACSIGQALSEENYLTDVQAEQLSKNLFEKRFTLLEMILSRLCDELKNAAFQHNWRNRLEERLYMKDKKVAFTPGPPDELSRGSVPAIEGILLGIGETGELRILEESGELHSFVTGELSTTPTCH